MIRYETKEILLIIFVSLAVFVGCIFLSQLILPESCNLFDNSPIDYVCIPCSQQSKSCAHDPAVSVAQLTFCIGLLSFFLPLVIYMLKKRRNRLVERTKFFD